MKNKEGYGPAARTTCGTLETKPEVWRVSLSREPTVWAIVSLHRQSAAFY